MSMVGVCERQGTSLTLKLCDIDLVSDNKLKYARGQYTPRARAMRKDILEKLKAYEKNIICFKYLHEKDIFKKGLNVEYRVHVPESLMYKKDGLISMRKGDATNYLKALNDFIFNPRDGIKNIDIDDKYIIKCTIEQIPNKDIKSINLDVLIKVKEENI